MATINIAITASDEQFSTFADELGYPTEVVVSTASDGTHTVGPNPESKVNFLVREIKNLTVASLARVKIKAIDIAEVDKKVAEKEAIKQGIAGAISVTVK